jgi:hypothetical protein
MADWMEQLTEAAQRQGWQVYQTTKGGWFFHRGLLTVTTATTPETASEWMFLVGALRGAGLIFPEK